MTWTRTPDDFKRHSTQKTLTLKHLQTGAPLTQKQARELYRIERLASRISELRKAGHLILSLRNSQGCATYLLLAAREEGDRA